MKTMKFDPSDCCSKCKRVFTADELRSWRNEFGIDAADVPHMQDVPDLCTDCAEQPVNPGCSKMLTMAHACAYA